MLARDEWLPLARKLDWDYSYVSEEEVFPEVISGHPWLHHSEWKDWEESFKTSYREYVDNQYEKDMAVYAVRDAVGRLENIKKLAAPWVNSLKVKQDTRYTRSPVARRVHRIMPPLEYLGCCLEDHLPCPAQYRRSAPARHFDARRSKPPDRAPAT